MLQRSLVTKRSVLFGSSLHVGLPALALLVLVMTGCGPSYPNCDNDENCQEQSEFCVDKLCRKCRTDNDCAVKNKCKSCDPNTYTCEHRPGCCVTDLDCPGGRCWVDPSQNTGQCGAMCRADSDCNPDQTCQFGACKARAECRDNSDCGPGQECQNGRCMDQLACSTQPVYFDYNESVLTSEAQRILGTNADCIKQQSDMVKIEGHCDERGTDEYNLALGNRRANSARTHLVNHGIVKNKLNTVSYGEERPVCRENTEGCWSKNRRAEFVLNSSHKRVSQSE